MCACIHVQTLFLLYSQLFELAVRQFNEVGVVEQDHHILGIKVSEIVIGGCGLLMGVSIQVDDDSGKFLSILTRHAFDQINMSR